MSTETSNDTGMWYFDSGCSRHMTGTKGYLKDIVPQNSGRVTYGGGTQGKVLGKGSLNLNGVPNLKDVLLIDGLTANLLSLVIFVMILCVCSLTSYLVLSLMMIMRL